MAVLRQPLVTLCAASCALAIGTWGRGAGGPDSADATKAGRSDADLRGILEEIDRRAKEVADLEARYEERKYTALLKEPLVSRGSVRVKGGRSLWEVKSPRRTITLITPEAIRIYYPDRKVLEVYEVGVQLRFLAVSPVPRVEPLKAHFRIETVSLQAIGGEWDASRDVALRFTPRVEELGRYVAEVLVVLDRETWHVRQAEVTDPDGDRTVLLFSEIRVNTGLTTGDVAIELPEGVVVTRPLAAPSSDTNGTGVRP